MKVFKVGQVIKMSVAKYSHVTKPYYVEVIEYNEGAKEGQVKMKTSIPGEHALEMTVGKEWDYHYPRMEIIGDKSIFGHLLKNQKLK